MPTEDGSSAQGAAHQSQRGNQRKRAAACGLLCVLLALSAQFLTVHYNFDGNWTALFHTGRRQAVPPSLEFENIYRFPGYGYDGQFYHHIAHSPLSPRKFYRYVDGITLRWRRILVPALAFALAGGQTEWVDAAFISVTLGFLFLGTYWLSRYAQAYGRHAAWGLTYLLLSSTLISIERLTVDMALVSLCVGVLYYAQFGPRWKTYPLLCAAPLVRETGLLAILGYGLYQLARRQYRTAAGVFATAIPWVGWALFVASITGIDPSRWTSLIPLQGLLHRTLFPGEYPLFGPYHRVSEALDYLAVLGLWLAFVMSAYVIRSQRGTPLPFLLGVFVAISTLASSKVWAESYAFGRYVSPILIWLAMAGLSPRRWWLGVPLLMFVPRVAAQLATHLPGILRGVAGF
jgi:hypothetical protein